MRAEDGLKLGLKRSWYDPEMKNKIGLGDAEDDMI